MNIFYDKITVASYKQTQAFQLDIMVTKHTKREDQKAIITRQLAREVDVEQGIIQWDEENGY